MSAMGRTIARNATVLMASQVVTWVLALALAVVVPRYLGPAGAGQLHLAGSLWAIVSLAVSFGMDTLLTKEIAKQPDRAGKYVGTSLGIRAMFYLVGLGGLLIYARLADYSTTVFFILIIYGVANIFWQIARTSRAALGGLERMEFSSAADIASKGFNTVTVIILLLLGQDILLIAAVAIGSGLISATVQIRAVRRLTSTPIAFDRPLSQQLPREAFPFLLTRIAREIYIQVDVVIISLLVTEDALGWYGAADILFGTLLFLPSVFVTAIFPALSRLYDQTPDAVSKVTSRSFNLLLLSAIPIGFGLVVLANPLVVLLFGDEFANAGPILAVFGIVLIFTYINMLLGQFLYAIDRQNRLTVLTVIAIVLTIPLDFILIPYCEAQFGNGAIGGALAFVVTELIILLGAMPVLPAGTLTRSTLFHTLRILLAGTIMAVITWQFRHLFVAIPLIIGVLTYAICVPLLRLITPEDWQLLLNLAKPILNRLFSRLKR